MVPRSQVSSSETVMSVSLTEAMLVSQQSRCALMLALVVRGENGEKSRESLETLCPQAAQHLALTQVFNAPEFSDRTQFRSAFDALLRAGLVKLDSAHCVHFEPTLMGRAEDAAFLLPPDTRAAVLRAAGHGASAAQRHLATIGSDTDAAATH